MRDEFAYCCCSNSNSNSRIRIRNREFETVISNSDPQTRNRPGANSLTLSRLAWDHKCAILHLSKLVVTFSWRQTCCSNSNSKPSRSKSASKFADLSPLVTFDLAQVEKQQQQHSLIITAEYLDANNLAPNSTNLNHLICTQKSDKRDL